MLHIFDMQNQINSTIYVSLQLVLPILTVRSTDYMH